MNDNTEESGRTYTHNKESKSIIIAITLEKYNSK